MSYNKALKGQQEDSQDTDTEFELIYMSDELGVPVARIKQAIKAVGNNRERIELYLASHL